MDKPSCEEIYVASPFTTFTDINGKIYYLLLRDLEKIDPGYSILIKETPRLIYIGDEPILSIPLRYSRFKHDLYIYQVRQSLCKTIYL